MTEDLLTKNLITYLFLSFFSIMCLCLYCLFLTSTKNISQAFLFGVYNYFKFCWFFIIWLILQNIFMLHFKINNIYILTLIGLLFSSFFIFTIWDESFFKDDFYFLFSLISVLSVSFTVITRKNIYNYRTKI